MPHIYQTGIYKSSGFYTISALEEMNQNGKHTPMDFGHRIEAVRIEKGMTREALAEKMGVTPTTIFRKERGSGDDKRGIKANELIEFAEALGCTLEYLIYGSSSSHNKENNIDDALLVACGEFAESYEKAHKIKTSREEHYKFIAKIYELVIESDEWKKSGRVPADEKVVELAFFRAGLNHAG